MLLFSWIKLIKWNNDWYMYFLNDQINCTCCWSITCVVISKWSHLHSVFFIFILADRGRNSSCGPTGYGHVWHLRSVCQSLPPARQKEEIWNKSSSQDTEPRLQWNIYLQGEQINGEGILHGDIKYRHFSTHFLKAVNFWYIIKGCYDVLVWIVCIIVSVYALLIFSWHTEMRTY